MNQNNQLAVIYCRVSSEKQEKEKTIESQVSELERIVVANGDILVKKYLDDGYSGELLERPALDQLRTDAAKRLFSRVYILSADRLARKFHIAAIVVEDLKRYGIEIIFKDKTLGESPTDILNFGIQGVIAEFNKAELLDKFRRGKLFKVRGNNIMGNTPPYGYRYMKDQKSRHGWYEINEKEAEVVRLIFSIYLSESCSGLGGLRRELHRQGIKNRSGSTIWSQSMVARVISNETYIGTTHWGKFRSIEGESKNGYRRLKNTKRVKKPKEEWLAIKVPPIIDEATFRAAEQKRASNKSLSPEKVKNPYILRGLMSHLCGAKMYSKFCHGQKYYVCSAKRNAFPEKATCDSSRHYNGEDLEALVWGEFLKVVQSPAMLMRRINQQRNNRGVRRESLKARVLDIEKAIARSEEKKSRLLAAYSEGVTTLEELKQQKDGIQKEIETGLKEKESLAAKLASVSEEAPQIVDLKSFAQRIKNLLEKADSIKKQRILRYFIESIVLENDTAVIRAVLPKELLVAPTSTLY